MHRGYLIVAFKQDFIKKVNRCQEQILNNFWMPEYISAT
jgi:hypothetical protein